MKVNWVKYEGKIWDVKVNLVTYEGKIGDVKVNLVAYEGKIGVLCDGEIKVWHWGLKVIGAI